MQNETKIQQLCNASALSCLFRTIIILIITKRNRLELSRTLIKNGEKINRNFTHHLGK